MLVVNLPVYDSALGDLTGATDLPVLQDTSEVDMGEHWGAAKSYVYLLDGQADARFIHYSLSFANDGQRLADEVTLLVAEEGGH